MSEFLFPGVFVEETSFRATPIDGVPTDIAAFVGPTRKGPVGVASQPLTSFSDFERRYGGLQDIPFVGDTLALHRRNYMAHAALAFFSNGGKRLYVVRVVAGFRKSAVSPGPLVPGFLSRLAAAVATEYAAACACLERIRDVFTVAAPGHSALASLLDDAGGDNDSVYRAIQTALLAHVADPLRCRMAVLDPPPGATPDQVGALLDRLASSRAALYYPWVIVANPLAGTGPKQAAELVLPPSGFVCGIYARNDIERGVHNAPANVEVVGALRLERDVTAAEQDLLNPLGVNTLRALPGRGLRVWGARTLSNDPEWKYVSVRRYFNFVSASIERGMPWTVFEPNGDTLWAQVRDAISNFLRSQWQTGALQGHKPEEAFFVQCDRTTMTQDDIDSGRLVCVIGMAALKPAEFVIVRIGLWTSDRKP